MIDIDGLRFRYRGAGVDAIAGLSLEVADGSLFGLLGPNGSGKTTLMALLTGTLVPASGQIRMDGKAMPAARRAVQAQVALVPQEHAFYPRLSVTENLEFFAGAQGVAARARNARVREAIEATGLANVARRRAQHLSGGLKRRLNLGIGLLGAPRVLLLDEPTVGIDPQSRHFILETIKRINAAGTTVVYTSHYMEEVQALCDSIAILDQGRVIAHGNLESLLGHGGGRPLSVGLAAAPDDALKAALAQVAPVRVDGSRLELADGSEAQLREMLGLLAQHGAAVTRVRYGYVDLEDLFLRLTGRQLRD